MDARQLRDTAKMLEAHATTLEHDPNHQELLVRRDPHAEYHALLALNFPGDAAIIGSGNVAVRLAQAPRTDLVELARYDIPVTHDLESAEIKATRVWTPKRGRMGA